MVSCPRHGFTKAQAGFDDSGKLRSCKKDKKRKYVRTYVPSIPLSLRNCRVERIVGMRVVERTSVRMKWIATKGRRLIIGLDD